MKIFSDIQSLFAQKRVRRILFGGALLFLLSGGLFLFFQKDNLAYNRLCREIFRQELTDNTLTLHYTLQNPKSYGLSYDEPKLPAYSPENQSAAKEAIGLWRTQLSAIDPERLSEKNNYSYRLLSRYLELQAEIASLPSYGEPLSPYSGMHSYLPVLFSEYRFETVQDIEDYLILLSQMDEYFQGLFLYEQEKAAAGRFMSPENAALLVEQCKNFFPPGSIEDGSHFMADTFRSRLLEFQENHPHMLDDDALENYCRENTRILTEEIVPAYEKLAEDMKLLSASQGADSATHGLGCTEEGRRYYALLVKKSTGSYRDMEDIQELLYAHFEHLSSSLGKLQSEGAGPSPQKNGARQTASPDKKAAAELSADDMLSLLQEDMKEDFPPLSSGTSCRVKYLPESLASASAPAFYLVPPMDALQKNVIYINPASSLAEVSLFTTLAHESFPGHLYQTVYSRESGLFTKSNPLRGLLDYPGYCEGWAFYVELESYQYAADYYPVNAAYQQTQRSLELCLCALLDFHIHYYGFSEQQTALLLKQFGISAAQSKNIYSYISQEPANYLKYYLSYLEILDLKNQAKHLWGENYSDYRFHRFYLEAGPSDFASLRELLLSTEK